MLTIIVPTKGRSNFIIRLLNYYVDTGYKHWIFIGDSSSSEHVERTKRAIKELGGRLKIVYNEYPELNEAQCTIKLIELVTTPFIAWLPDDDILVSDSMERCVRFLEEHPDYTVALGKAILLKLESSSSHGQISGVGPYKLRSIEAESARERILDHLSNYSNSNFGIRRTKQVREVNSRGIMLSDLSFTELLPNCMASIQGKVKQLDCLYLVRQAHCQRYLLPDTYDWLTSSGWFQSYQVFCDSLVQALVRQDDITEKDAHSVVKQAFWGYLGSGVCREFQKQKVFQKKIIAFRQKVKGIPGAKALYNKIKRKTPGSQNAFCLGNLLKRSSPYHKDFMPVYNVITSSEEKFASEIF